MEIVIDVAGLLNDALFGVVFFILLLIFIFIVSIWIAMIVSEIHDYLQSIKKKIISINYWGVSKHGAALFCYYYFRWGYLRPFPIVGSVAPRQLTVTKERL